MQKFPLAVFIIHHPAFPEANNYREIAFSVLNRDVKNPLQLGLGVPVFFHTHPENSERLINSVSEYENVVVFALIDRKMLLGKEKGWADFLDKLVDATKSSDGRLKLIPVGVDDGKVVGITQKISQSNFQRLYELPPETRAEGFERGLLIGVSRILYDLDFPDLVPEEGGKLNKPVRIFLSHTKRDSFGVEIAKSLDLATRQLPGLAAFFDTQDIPEGNDFGEIIKNHVSRSALLVVQTDSYGSREWCKYEVLTAKRNLCPIVVVDAVKEKEVRTFPYMWNCVSIEWFPGQEKLILQAVMREYIRISFNKRVLRYAVAHNGLEAGTPVLPVHPELFHLSSLKKQLTPLKEEWVIHPSPPIGFAEKEVLTEMAPEIQFTTPEQLPSLKAGNGMIRFLENKKIGISISIPDSENPHELGILHLQDAMVEIARSLLSAGAVLCYGGDVRFDGGFNFAQLLFDLAEQHNAWHYERGPMKIRNYLIADLFAKLSDEDQVKLMDHAELIEVPEPRLGANEKKENKNALAFSDMRKMMTDEISARVIMGGKNSKYAGKYPGIVEEGFLALKAGKPLYLCGAFGGAAETLIRALKGQPVPELSAAFQLAEDAGYQERISFFERIGLPIDYPGMVNDFKSLGVKELSRINGLSEAENQILFAAADINVVISLVMKGLSKIG